MNSWSAQKELDSRGLGALYPLFPRGPLQNGCCLDANHTTIQSGTANIFNTASGLFPQTPKVPPVVHFQAFLTTSQGPGMSQPRGCRGTGASALLHCKTTILPPMAASPSARARFSLRVLRALAPGSAHICWRQPLRQPLPSWALSQGPCFSRA